jgi:site-specific recombinase XerD
MSALIEAYLQHLEHSRGRAGGTVGKYGGHLRRLEGWLGERGSSIERATRVQVEEFCGIHAHKIGISPRSRRPLVAAVRGFYTWMVRRGDVSSSPAEYVSYPAAGRALPRPTTLQHAEKMLMTPDVSTLQGARDAAIMGVFIGCGVRLSGLCALNESQLQAIEIDGVEWLILRVVEKGKKERLVPIPHEARLLLLTYLGHPDLALIDRTLPNSDRVLFVSLRNQVVPVHEYHGERRRLSARSVQDMLIKYALQAGVPRAEAHPHALRHLFGTELAEHDVHLLRMQTLLGHVNANDTKTYTHLAIRTLVKEISRANPLRRMKTPVSELVRELAARKAL